MHEPLLTQPTASRVGHGHVESNPSLAERYSLLGAAALVVTISDTYTIPFRVTIQPP